MGGNGTGGGSVGHRRNAHACPASGDSIQASQAQQRQRLVVALLDRRVEDHRRVGADGEPAVLGQFGFELALAPGRIAQRHQHLARAGAGGERFQHVLGGGHLQAAGNGHGRGVDRFVRLVGASANTGSCSTKPRSVCTGPPWNTGALAEVGAATGAARPSRTARFRLMSLGLLITRPERAALAVLAQVDHAAAEGLVLQPRHRDQEMMRQVHRGRIGGHAADFTGRRQDLSQGPDVVSPRPARRRQRGALPRPAQPAGRCVCVFVFDTRILDAAAARGPAGRVHPRIAGRAGRTSCARWAAA